MDPELANLVVAHLGDVLARHEDPAGGDDTVARQVAKRGVRCRRLAATGLTDESIRLPGAHLERDAAEDRAPDAADDIGE